MYDLIIKNGIIVDGTGSPSYTANIAVKNGKIVKIGKNLDGAKSVIDASGLTVTPGFIDSHSHSDRAVFYCPDMIEKIEQGVTTSISGQCGGSIAPCNVSEERDTYIDGVGNLSDVLKTFSSFADATKRFPLGSNNVCLVGHGSIRKCVMGMSQEKPSEEELQKMKTLLRDAMESGALGISFGLIYPPSRYAETDELVEIAKVVKEYEGIVAAHIRSEGDKLIEATEEFIHIIKESGVRGILSHHKACGGSKNFGKVIDTLKLIDKANAEGTEIYLDVYPYVATATSAAVTFVPDSGRELLERLGNPQEREKIREWNKTKWWADNWSWVLINKSEGYPEYEGMMLTEAAKIHGKDECDTILDIIYKGNGRCTCCYFTMCEEDVERVISHPRAMICTDSGVAGIRTSFHPRLKASFPRALGRYVREKGIVSLPEMIRKMTSMPARVYGLETKGLIWEGMDADICIFDAERIIDRSEFMDCNKRAEGLNYVILNGEIVARDAVYNQNKQGKVILVNR